MLQLQVDVAKTDTARRLIEGVAVPYGETAQIAGLEYRFAPYSLSRARAITPLLLGHNDNEPVGVLAEWSETGEGMRARFRVDKTPDGDRALAQAKSGSRGGLSIGFEITAAKPASDGVIEVTGADVYEVSLVAVPAFAGAQVERVAAQATLGEEPEPEPVEAPVEAPAEGEEEEEEEEEDEDASGGEAPAETPPEEDGTMSEAAAPRILVAERDRRRQLSAGEFVSLTISAQHGDSKAARLIQAALTETISTDVTGLLPPTYERTVIGEREVDRPLYNAFRGRPIPAVGLNVVKPKWTTHTAGAEAANVDADATTSKVVIGTQTATVKRWDWAGAISWVVVQRSDPSVIDEIYADAVVGFYLYVEGKIGGQLLAAAAGTAVTIGAAMAEFYVATGNTRTAEVIVMAPDVWGKFADKSALASSIVVGGVSGAGDLTATLAGVPVVVSGTLTAGTTVLATRRAVDARITEPVRLTANAIGALNVELAVVGEGLFDTDYPAEMLKFAALLPA